MRHLMLVAVAAVAAFGLAACGESGSEAAAEAMAGQVLGQDVEIEGDGDTVTIGGLRISSGDAAKVPDGFPEDVYLPAEYALQSVMESDESTTLQMTTDVAADALYADAVEAMTGQGWTQGMAIPPTDGMGLASFEKDNRRASISVDDQAEEDTFYAVETGIRSE